MKSIKLLINKVKSIISRKDYLDLLEERGFKHGKNFKMYDCNIDFGHCYLIEVGDDVIVGAGSVVTRDIPSNSIVAGNPAKVIGKTSDFIDKHKNMMNESPVYSVYWQEKSEEEINSMKIELEDVFGYDE